VEKVSGMYYLTSPLSSSLIIKLREEVRTRNGEIRKPVPFASNEGSLRLENFYLDFIHPMLLKGKFKSSLSHILILRSSVLRQT
jgi:hypothetical protein